MMDHWEYPERRKCLRTHYWEYGEVEEVEIPCKDGRTYSYVSKNRRKTTKPTCQVSPKEHKKRDLGKVEEEIERRAALPACERPESFEVMQARGTLNFLISITIFGITLFAIAYVIETFFR